MKINYKRSNSTTNHRFERTTDQLQNRIVIKTVGAKNATVQVTELIRTFIIDASYNYDTCLLHEAAYKTLTSDD